MPKIRILSKLDEVHEKIFEQIIERNFDPKRVGACFWESVDDFQKILRNLGYTYRIEDVKKPLARIYIREAGKQGITPRILSLDKRREEKLKNLRKSKKPLFSVFVTPAMKKGAKKSRVSGSDEVG